MEVTSAAERHITRCGVVGAWRIAETISTTVVDQRDTCGPRCAAGGRSEGPASSPAIDDGRHRAARWTWDAPDDRERWAWSAARHGSRRWAAGLRRRSGL